MAPGPGAMIELQYLPAIEPAISRSCRAGGAGIDDTRSALGQPAAALEWAAKALAALPADNAVPPAQRRPVEDGLKGRIARLKKSA